MSEFHFGGSSTKRAELFRKKADAAAERKTKAKANAKSTNASTNNGVKVKTPVTPPSKVVIRADGKRVKKKSKPVPVVLER